MKTSIGWRMTEPLRRANYWRNRWRSRRAGANGAASDGSAPH